MRLLYCASFALTIVVSFTAKGQTHFHYTSNTGNNATVAVPTTANPDIGGAPLASGDEIGAFTPDGLCVGAVVWNGANAVITVWGDNDQTSEVDGIRSGEQVSYHIWQQSTNTEYISVNVAYLQGNGVYSANAIYILSSLSAVVPPTAPQLLSPSDGATDISVTPTLTWYASLRATSYRIQISMDASFSSTLVDQSNFTSTSYVTGGLVNNTTYYWRVNAANSGGTSNWSGIRAFTTSPQAPSAPTLASPPNGVTNQPLTPTLSWASSAGAASYRLEVSTRLNFSTRIFDDDSLTQTSQVVGPLAYNTNYYWRVRASNAGGTSGWSEIWHFTTDVAVPSAPILNSPANGALNQPTTVNLIWNGSAGAVSYHLQVSTDALYSSFVVDQSGISPTSYSVGGLFRNTTYYWRVNGTNTGGTSEWSTGWSFTTIPNSPATPTLASPSDGATNQPTSITLVWNPSPGATMYHLQVSTDFSFSSTVVDDSSLTTTAYLLASSVNLTVYHWRVKATNAGGTSNWSNPSTFTTRPADSQAGPTLTSPTNGSINQPLTVTLSWNSAIAATAYELQVSKVPDFSTAVYNNSGLTNTSQQVGPLSYNTLHYWRARAFYASLAGDWSDVWTFTTVAGNTPTITTNSPANITDSSATFNVSVNPNGYSTLVRFQYGTATNYGNSIDGTPATINGTIPINVSGTIHGLIPNTTYHYRSYASNSAGTTYGEDNIFTTSVPSYPSTYSLNKTVSFPSYPNVSNYHASDYRIIGLPGASNSIITTLLSGVQDKDWQVYWDNGSSQNGLVKFNGGAAFRFTTGNAFWVIKKGPWTINTDVPSAPMNSSQQVEIPLHSGWNLITNPFTSPTSWTQIQNIDSISDPLYSFSGSFSISNNFSPYVGYYFFNRKNLPVLKIPYSAQFQVAQSTVEQLETIWKVGITVSSNEGTDSLLWIGVSRPRDYNTNKLNYHKPRAVGSMPQTYFDRVEWDPEYHSFATDIRPDFVRVQTWSFDVNAEPGIPLKLIFSGIGDVPSQFQVYLVDQQHATFVDLRKVPLYEFTPVDKESKLAVTVGTGEAVKEQLDKIPVPHRFVLEQNYPNPFNPSTSIPVGIPTRSEIELKIFNILGQEIRTLYSGAIDQGRYRFTWDGKGSSGETLPSGVYVYRLTTETGVTQAQKMNLTR
jgi:hypothetical protein